jgi:hypothetical protein
MENAWTRGIEDIARELDVDLHTGLTNHQVQTALSKYGKNGICHPPTFVDMQRCQRIYRLRYGG